MNSNWKYESLGKILKTTSGGTPARSNKLYYLGSIPWLKSGELNDNMHIIKSKEHITEEAIKKSSAKLFPKNSVLIALYGATTGKLGILEKESTTNQAVCAILPNKDYSPKLIFYYLLSKRQYLINKGKGGAQPNISQGVLKNLEIPLISPEQQQLIIDEIEKQFTRLDASVKTFKEIKKKLEVYRKSVLNAAFRGEFSKTCRIQFDKEKFLEEINLFNTNKGGQDKTTRLPIINYNDLTDLPEEWMWIKAHKICSSVRDGTHDTPKYVNSGYPLVTSKNLTKSFLDLSKIKYISERDFIEINKRSKVDVGDILFGMIGTIGSPVVIEEEPKFAIKNVGLFKVNNNYLSSKYLKYWLDSQLFLKIAMQKKLIRGTTQSFISLGSLRISPIPYCNIEEQTQIVQEIESRFSVIDKLEETINKALNKSEQLRKSILKSAFEGKLIKAI